MTVEFNIILAAGLAFSEPMYSISENSGLLELILILSNPSSTAFTVQVFTTTNNLTIGKCINLVHFLHHKIYIRIYY